MNKFQLIGHVASSVNRPLRHPVYFVLNVDYQCHVIERLIIPLTHYFICESYCNA